MIWLSSFRVGDEDLVGNNQGFRQFAEGQYQFSWWLSRQRDTARQQPQVSAAQLALAVIALALAVIAQVFFGLRSLLRVDQWLRTSLAVAWLRCATTGRRGSDTTLLKALAAWDQTRLRQATYAVHLRLRDQGLCRTTLSTGKSVRLDIVDGTAIARVAGVGSAQDQGVDRTDTDGNGIGR